MASNKIVFERKSLFQWIKLEEARSKIKEDFKSKDARKVSASIFGYVQLASKDGEIRDWDKLDTATSLSLYAEATAVNAPTKDFPVLKASVETKEPPPWEYPGRAWYFWFNMLSKNYGWDKDYISALDPDDAIGLYQEIEIEHQLEREWQWGLTEIAYPYDPHTKTSKFKPLTRPNWMLPIAPKPKIVRIRKDMLPVGNIVGDDDLTQAVDAERNP